jgi:cysteine desulfurase
MPKKVYLDHAAATPVDPTVLAAMQPYFTQQFYNPSASYQAAREVRRAVEAARAEAAVALGVTPHEIIFTAGATEANNLAIHGVMERFPGKKVLVSAIEHDSVLETAKHYNHALIPVDQDGHVKEDALRRLIDDDTVLVSIMWANNEVGTIQRLGGIGDILREERGKRILAGNQLPLYLHSDAAQAMNYLNVYPHRSHVDLVSLNGGKIYGPKQSGLLFVSKKVELDPFIVGGGQERGLRSGTENVPAIVGLAMAMTQATTIRLKERERLTKLQLACIKAIYADFPGASVNGLGAHSLPNILHISFPGQDNERLMMELDELGIQVAVGSACSASSDEPSHVLKAMGLSDAQAQSSLRISMGRSTTKKDMDQLITALKELTRA